MKIRLIGVPYPTRCAQYSPPPLPQLHFLPCPPTTSPCGKEQNNLILTPDRSASRLFRFSRFGTSSELKGLRPHITYVWGDHVVLRLHPALHTSPHSPLVGTAVQAYCRASRPLPSPCALGLWSAVSSQPQIPCAIAHWGNQVCSFR